MLKYKFKVISITMRKSSYFILWPEYFDKRLSRKMGRRVPLSIAVSRPTVSEIAEAAKALGYKVILQEEKSYPKCWYENRGRVLVDRGDKKKSEIIREISLFLSKKRSKSK